MSIGANSKPIKFFNPYVEIRHTSGKVLPHWQQDGSVYFVTFRLADAVPAALRRDWEAEKEAWLGLHPKPWSTEIEMEYHQRFSQAIEQWLDAGHGACLLRRPECSSIVMDTLRHFDGDRISLISAVVMPNHVHALFVLNPSQSLEKLLYSWKTFPAKRINSLIGRSGNVWQRDYFDRLVRDSAHLANCIRYIRRNPGKAGLSDGEWLLFESELARAVD